MLVELDVRNVCTRVSLIIRTFLQPKRRKDIYILAHLYYDNIYRADLFAGERRKGA